ncbi:beta-galactosidase [Neptuniibacter sp. QD34_54]|uniref:beta-galactosidase n=1 Tax=Neptuniibacter sp. QD34_54 TaxID=3398208 RepID=UPI0039F4F7E6
MHFKKITYLCVIFAWLAPLSSIRAEPIDLKKLKVPLSYSLGLAFPGSDPAHYYLIKDAGIGIVRLSVSWKHIQPHKNTFNWAGLDQRIATLQRYNIQPFLTLESNATWATKANSQQVKNGSPKDLNDWHQFVTQVVDRYNFDGQNDAPKLLRPVKFYQVANEWISNKNRSGGWADSTNSLIQYINTAYVAVKASDPEAAFVLGGIASFNLDTILLAEGLANFQVQQRWSNKSQTLIRPQEAQSVGIKSILNGHVREVLSKAKYDLADAHLYGPYQRDKKRIQLIANETNLPIQKIVSTECGGPSLDYSDSYNNQDHFYAVLNRNLHLLSTGSPFCLWFGLGELMTTTWGNRKVPLFDKNNKTKPGYFAYKLLAYLFDGEGGITIEHLKDISSQAYQIKFPNSPTHPDIYVGLNIVQEKLITKLDKAEFDTLCINSLNTRGSLTRNVTNVLNCDKGIVAIGTKLPSLRKIPKTNQIIQ